MSQLDFKAFKQAGAKVKTLVFHPVQPWLAYADVNHTITVWDWTNQQVVWEVQLSGADEGTLQDAMLQRLAEKETGYYGKAAIPRPGATAKGTAPGAVKDLQFLDTEACYWQLALQHSMQYRAHSKAGLPHLGRVRGLKGHRWLIAACETKILMTDLVSRASREVPRAVMDGRAPTSLAFLYKCSPLLLGYGAGENNSQAIITPVMAVGTSAGVIYLISVSTLQVYAKLTGAHKSSVTKLLVLGGREQGGPDFLLSCSADGTVAVWEPSAAAPQGPDKEISAKVSFKAHDGAVLAMQLFQVNQGSPDPGPLRLITSGDDKRVAVWEAWTWKEGARTRPFAKGAADSLAFSPRAGAATGAEPCIVLSSGERAALWGLYPTSRQLEVREVASLDSLVPAGQKKLPKVYRVACHPLLPHVIAVGANTGVGLLSFDPQVPPPVAPFPLPAPAPADLDSPRAAPSTSAPFRGCEYVVATESQLWHVAYRPGWSEGPSGRQLDADLKSKHSVASFGPHGRAEVALSWDGAHCSVVWPEECRYTVYATEPLASKAPWREVARGSAIAVVWASASSTFAVLHVPKAAAPTPTTRSKKKLRAKEEDAAAAAAQAAASAAAAANTAVEVYRVEEGGAVKQVCSNVIMGSDRPTSLHGGAVLGVGFDKKIRPGHRRGQAMRWYSWSTYGGIGEVMVEPRWISWGPDASVAVLAYDDTLVFCRTQPTFSAFASLPLKDATSGAWHSHQLYVTTPSAVYCVMVASHADSTTPHLEVVRLASHAGGAVAQAAAAGDAAAALPAETLRCAGPTVCAGVREGVLWLLDTRGQPFVLPTSHAGLRARSLALAGAPALARSVAEQGVDHAVHLSDTTFSSDTAYLMLP
ncbi:hypothetical protein COCOBI_14-0960 [Coccomyxa sp. Obi]|nr:hypothetical protein COCOBI_14-0960 [Coccomyxa sp. Obi]